MYERGLDVRVVDALSVEHVLGRQPLPKSRGHILFSLWWLPVPNAAAHRLIMSSGESPPPQMLRSSYRGALIGSAYQQAHLLETEDRTGSAPKAWEHRLVKCAPRHGVSAGSKASAGSPWI